MVSGFFVCYFLLMQPPQSAKHADGITTSAATTPELCVWQVFVWQSVS